MSVIGLALSKFQVQLQKELYSPNKADLQFGGPPGKRQVQGIAKKAFAYLLLVCQVQAYLDWDTLTKNILCGSASEDISGLDATVVPKSSSLSANHRYGHDNFSAAIVTLVADFLFQGTYRDISPVHSCSKDLTCQWPLPYMRWGSTICFLSGDSRGLKHLTSLCIEHTPALYPLENYI